jgi:ADP-ribose pyrophosphatase YjhB (NUDIX family)
VEEYKQKIFVSGSEHRNILGKLPHYSIDFRHGCIYATQNQFDSALACVDAAIFNDENLDEIYLAQKNTDGGLWRFIGGFVDPHKDASYELAVKREVVEETSLEINVGDYVCSCMVPDWRYKNEVNKIFTSLFICIKSWGRPNAQDDISQLKMFSFSELTEDMFVNEHRQLFTSLKKYVEKHNDTSLTQSVSKMLD